MDRDPYTIRISGSAPVHRAGQTWTIRPFSKILGVRIRRYEVAADVERTVEFEEWLDNEVATRVRPDSRGQGRSGS